MKKYFLTIMALAFLLVFASFASAEDVAYVVGDSALPTDSEIAIVNILEDDFDFTVNLVDDDDLSSLPSYDLLIVADSAENPYVVTLPVMSTNSIIMNGHFVKEWGLEQDVDFYANYLGSYSYIHVDTSTDGLHAISSPYNYLTHVTRDSSWILGNYDVLQIVIHEPDGERAAKGDGSSFAVIVERDDPCSAFFGIQGADKWNDAGEDLFKRTVLWSLNCDIVGITDIDADTVDDSVDNCVYIQNLDQLDGDGDGIGDVCDDDFDNDGVLNEDDNCIDDYNPGQEDYDLDGIGDACDNDADGDGYIIDDDCDDFNEFINPGQDEIYYNGIDDDCDPLTIDDDQDGDGSVYTEDCDDLDPDRSPLFEEIYYDGIDNDCDPLTIDDDQDGDGSIWPLDCDDLDPNRFPGNPEILDDLDQNCVNDAPELNYIPDVFVTAGDLVDVNESGDVWATDVDGDEVQILFDTPLDEFGQWQTEYYHVGQYLTTVTAFDGDLTDTQQVLIDVRYMILINEFVSDPETGGVEWIELYNPVNAGGGIDLSTWTIEDGTGADYLLTGKVMAPNGYLVLEKGTDFSFSLNNAGDIIILRNHVAEVVDQVTFGTYDDGDISDNALNPVDGQSGARMPDGEDTDVDMDDFVILDLPTKGLSNEADVTPPEVTLSSPADGYLSTVDDITLTFYVDDNEALAVDCALYTDTTGVWELNEWYYDIAVGSEPSFTLYDLDDGIYIWNVECYDEYSSGFAAEDWSFEIDENDAPELDFIEAVDVFEGETAVIEAFATDPDGDDLIYDVDDYRFIPIGGGVFEWQTDYLDAGEYPVLITVTDGYLEDSQEVLVTVENFNRDPVFVGDITVGVFEEDTPVADLFDLNDYFYDLDEDDTLTFSYSGNTNVLVDLVEGVVSFSFVEDWNGEETLVFTATDTHDGSTDSNDVLVVVNPVNDAPELVGEIPNQTWLEDESLDDAFDLNDYFYDAEDDESLTFDYSGNVMIDISIDVGVVSFSQPADWNGVEEVTFTADDGDETTSSNVVVLTVENVNEDPTVDPIADQEIDEDSGQHQVEVFGYDSDGEIVEINVIDEDVNKVDCEGDVLNDQLLYEPAEDYFGSDATCTIEVVDNEGGTAETTVNFVVNNVNDAPEIVSYVPGFDPIITEDGSQAFSVVVSDIDSDAGDLTIKWYVDDVYEATGDSFVYNADGTTGLNEYDVKAVVDDTEFEDDQEWLLTTTSYPIGDSFGLDFSNYTEEELGNVTDLVLAIPGVGMIHFPGPIDLTDVADLDNFIVIMDNLISLDTGNLGAFSGQPATLTMYGLDFTLEPTIYFDSGFTTDPAQITDLCTNCGNVVYANGTLSFDITHFSTYMAGQHQTCGQQGGDICNSDETCEDDNWLVAFDSNVCCAVTCTDAPLDFEDLDTCEDGIIGDLTLDIKEPDDGDDFKAGDEIDIEVNVENDADEDLDVIVEAILYDIDDEDDIEGVESDEIEVEEGKDEDFDLTLVVPGDFEDGNEFILYVKAYEDGHEDDHCYEEYIEVELEREDHHVVIEDFTISPSVTEQGNTIGINVEIKNFGTKDEDDIVVTVKNTALDMDLREEGIDLEEYDDDDDAVIHFTFAIPEDIPGDDYTLTATLDYGHGSDTETAVLKIIGEGGSEAVVFVDNGESVGSSGAVGVTGGSVAQVEFEGKSNMYVITLIILMIIVILLIIWMIKALTKI